MKLLIKNISEINNYQKFLKKIKKDKIKKINKLQNNNKKKLSILGEMLFIEGIKRFYNIDYQNITIKYNKNNKPYIPNSNIFFNISHKNNYAVCVFSNKEIGVDIEKIKDINHHIINNYYNEEEKKFSNNPKNFYKIFTLKEAYVKCYGKTILDIKDINFTFKNNIIKCNEKNVTCKQFFIEDYIISIIEKR